MHRRLSVLIILAIIAASCGSGGSSSTEIDTTTAAPATTAPITTAPPTTTAAPTTTALPTTTTTAPPTPDELAGDGPYEVGVTTRTLPTGNLVEIYYPSTDVAAGRSEEYRVRDFLPALIAKLIPADALDTFAVEAARDAPASPGEPFPVVLFSHGFSGFRLQSTALLRHLASWGMVVASPDHPSRDLNHTLGEASEDAPDAADDLRASLAVLGDSLGDPVLDNLADTSLVALGGHSAGGFTIVSMASDDGIAGYVSYASGAGEDLLQMPDAPSLFIAASGDTVVLPDVTASAFERAPSSSWMWTLDQTGHLAFSDLCAVGDGDSTLIDLAEAAGIGDFIPDDFRRLGTDGCEPPNRPVEEVWPAIFQASTSFYRWVFGIDAEPLGLDSTSVESVTIATH